MMDTEQNIELMTVGFTLLLAQGVVVSNPFFNESEIHKYLGIRKQFHPVFIEACLEVADAFEQGDLGDKVLPAVPILRRISRTSTKQSPQQALLLATKAFRTLGKLRMRDLHNPSLVRAIYLCRLVSGEEQAELADGDFELTEYNYAEFFKAAIKLKLTPPKVKTFFRRILKLGLSGSLTSLQRGGNDNPGAWFLSMSDKERKAAQRKLANLEKRMLSVFKEIQDPTERHAAYMKLVGQHSALLATTGVSEKIIQSGEGPQEPLSKVLRREAKLQMDGCTEFVILKVRDDIEEAYKNPWGSYQLSKGALRKLHTQLGKARTFGTVQRILQEAVGQKILSDDLLKHFAERVKGAYRNKALAEGIAIQPLTWVPLSVEGFQTRYDAGDVEFVGDFSPEKKEEILGRVGRAISDLEMIFGKGFCGAHRKRLAFRFHEGSYKASALASFFTWDDPNVWQPRVKFGSDYEGLLAHELSHYMEGVLADKAHTRAQGSPGEWAADDIFGRTGVTLEYWLESQESPERQAYFDFPEVVELMQAVSETADYQRWKDKISGGLDSYLGRAIQEITGKSPYDQEEYQDWGSRHYKSEFPPEVIERAEQLYSNAMQGDTRGLRYYQSPVEIWARMCEQYVYTRLSRLGIVNPWLTQMSYEEEDFDQFVNQKVFEKTLEPILNNLFKAAKSKDLIASVLRKMLALHVTQRHTDRNRD